RRAGAEDPQRPQRAAGATSPAAFWRRGRLLRRRVGSRYPASSGRQSPSLPQCEAVYRRSWRVLRPLALGRGELWGDVPRQEFLDAVDGILADALEHMA